MPPKSRRCAATVLVSSPPLPASTAPAPASSATSSSSEGSVTTSPGGTTRTLPATLATRTSVPCPNVAQRIVGDCSFCGKAFCGNHRLPEHHGCANLQACRDAAHAANKAKLESERTVARKVAST